MVNKFLIIEARFYDDILDSLAEGAIEKLEHSGFEYDRLQVPGALEIPAAIAMAADTSLFLGFVALGCIIRGQTSHYDIVSNGSARGLMYLSIEKKLAIGNGIITAENIEQAWDRARASRKKNKGGDAALAAIKMHSIKVLYS